MIHSHIFMVIIIFIFCFVLFSPFFLNIIIRNERYEFKLIECEMLADGTRHLDRNDTKRYLCFFLLHLSKWMCMCKHYQCNIKFNR